MSAKLKFRHWSSQEWVESNAACAAVWIGSDGGEEELAECVGRLIDKLVEKGLLTNTDAATVLGNAFYPDDDA